MNMGERNIERSSMLLAQKCAMMALDHAGWADSHLTAPPL